MGRRKSSCNPLNHRGIDACRLARTADPYAATARIAAPIHEFLPTFRVASATGLRTFSVAGHTAIWPVAEPFRV